MKITWLGHSSFRLVESTGTTVVTDPYDAYIGYEMPEVSADIVTVSHSHRDHNKVSRVSGSPEILSRAGAYDISGVHILARRTYHDGEEGSRRGENLVFKFRMDGVDICHMGDIGEECTAMLVDSIAPVNVLLIPVGGTYTIDAEQAKEYIDRIMPAIVIPMHYKTKGLNLDIDKIDAFTDKFDSDEVEELEDSELELFRDDISEETTKIIVMEREK